MRLSLQQIIVGEAEKDGGPFANFKFYATYHSGLPEFCQHHGFSIGPDFPTGNSLSLKAVSVSFGPQFDSCNAIASRAMVV